jgi:hypothetical protein
LLNRELKVDKPNTVWVGDTSNLKAWFGILIVAANMLQKPIVLCLRHIKFNKALVT